MKNEFASVQQCANLPEGRIEDLTFLQMPPVFACQAYASGCSGEYRPPNRILLGVPSLARHEILHYLLDVNEGNADRQHKDPRFLECT